MDHTIKYDPPDELPKKNFYSVKKIWKYKKKKKYSSTPGSDKNQTIQIL